MDKIYLILLSVVLFSCTPEPGQILFDQGHGQAFTIEQEGPLQLGEFSKILSSENLNVQSTDSELTGEKLRDYSGLIISGPFKPLSSSEIDAIKEYIAEGGRVAIMLHIAQPLWSLLDDLGVDVANGVLRESIGTIENKPTHFTVTDFSSHSLTRDLTQFSLYGGWPLRPATHNTQVIARSSSQAWVDLNRDDILNQGDAVQHFAVIVSGKMGKGEFLIFADDAIFQNRFLDQDNRSLASNLARWFSEQ